nr:DUF3761 domain-containing protein [Paraburkholderia unamae]
MKITPNIKKSMKTIAAIVVAVMSLAATSANAYSSTPRTWTQLDEGDLTSHGHYVNHDGRDVHSPSRTKDRAVPPGATARCGDGSYSFSQHHSGTCSRHGGVAEWE